MPNTSQPGLEAGRCCVALRLTENRLGRSRHPIELTRCHDSRAGKHRFARLYHLRWVGRWVSRKTTSASPHVNLEQTPEPPLNLTDPTHRTQLTHPSLPTNYNNGLLPHPHPGLHGPSTQPLPLLTNYRTLTLVQKTRSSSQPPPPSPQPVRKPKPNLLTHN